MRYLKDKHGVIWGIVLLIGVVLLSSPWELWSKGLGGFLCGLAYSSVWTKSTNHLRNQKAILEIKGKE